VTDSEGSAQVSDLLNRITQAWLKGNIGGLEACLHEQVVMVFPGFQGSAVGREAMLAGFRDFSENARVLSFAEADRHIDVAGDTGVGTFRFELKYERDARKFESRGRDLWIFERHEDTWHAVWRTMLDLSEIEMK
jgi:hypothetical protein